MQARLITIGLLLVASLTSGGIPNHSQDQNGSQAVHGPDINEKRLAVNLVRVINTAEMSYSAKDGGSFAEWDALSVSQGFKQAIDDFSHNSPKLKDLNVGAPADIMPGWRLRLTVSSDKKSYAVAVSNTSDKECSYALVSDEEGVIREARMLGCPKG
jgi:hypothetical protein